MISITANDHKRRTRTSKGAQRTRCAWPIAGPRYYDYKLCEISTRVVNRFLDAYYVLLCNSCQIPRCSCACLGYLFDAACRLPLLHVASTPNEHQHCTRTAPSSAARSTSPSARPVLSHASLPPLAWCVAPHLSCCPLLCCAAPPIGPSRIGV